MLVRKLPLTEMFNAFFLKVDFFLVPVLPFFHVDDMISLLSSNQIAKMILISNMIPYQCPVQGRLKCQCSQGKVDTRRKGVIIRRSGYNKNSEG